MSSLHAVTWIIMGRLRGPALASACTRISFCMAILNLREFSSVMPALKKYSGDSLKIYYIQKLPNLLCPLQPLVFISREFLVESALIQSHCPT